MKKAFSQDIKAFLDFTIQIFQFSLKNKSFSDFYCKFYKPICEYGFKESERGHQESLKL